MLQDVYLKVPRTRSRIRKQGLAAWKIERYETHQTTTSSEQVIKATSGAIDQPCHVEANPLTSNFSTIKYIYFF